LGGDHPGFHPGSVRGGLPCVPPGARGLWHLGGGGGGGGPAEGQGSREVLGGSPDDEAGD